MEMPQSTWWCEISKQKWRHLRNLWTGKRRLARFYQSIKTSLFYFTLLYKLSHFYISIKLLIFIDIYIFHWPLSDIFYLGCWQGEKFCLRSRAVERPPKLQLVLRHHCHHHHHRHRHHHHCHHLHQHHHHCYHCHHQSNLWVCKHLARHKQLLPLSNTKNLSTKLEMCSQTFKSLKVSSPMWDFLFRSYEHLKTLFTFVIMIVTDSGFRTSSLIFCQKSDFPTF